MSKCGLKTEIYSRVVGYFRPTENWNRGKLEEFKERKKFIIPVLIVPTGWAGMSVPKILNIEV